MRRCRTPSPIPIPTPRRTKRSAAEVVVTGTRQSGMQAANSPAPIQVLDANTLKRVGQPDLIQAIAQNVPSFNAQAFGGDTANLTLRARLRGLSPNHALVLIDGKRRRHDRQPRCARRAVSGRSVGGSQLHSGSSHRAYRGAAGWRRRSVRHRCDCRRAQYHPEERRPRAASSAWLAVATWTVAATAAT